MSLKYRKMFEPFQIGSLKLKNRIVMAAMGTRGMTKNDGSFSSEGGDYFVERAKGGAGLIVTGVTYVENEIQKLYGDGMPLITRNPANFIENSVTMTERIHAYGCRIFIQLSAGSGRVQPPAGCVYPVVSSSPVPNFWDPSVICRELTREEIKNYVRSFAEGAVIAQKAGFDGVEIHAVHEGYLLDQFTIACTNFRSDEYGGSLENRLRFPVEILHAIKECCGDKFPVVMRYSVKSYMKGFNSGALPGEDFVEFGRDLDEGIRVAQMFEAAGYDALDCDNGSYDAWYWAHPPVYMPQGLNNKNAARVRENVGIPVIVSGKLDPEMAEGLLAEGKVDAVAFARGFVADSRMVMKIRKNRMEDIRPCIGCHTCFARTYSGLPLGCALNPAIGRESAYGLKPAKTSKRIVIVGGGVGGMEAARVCAERGHKVILLEKSGELGGVFIAAAMPHFKSEDKKLLTWYKYQLDQLGIDIRFNVDADVQKINDLAPDAVIVATGGRPKKIDVPGFERATVLQAKEALLHGELVAPEVAIVGGGLTGCEIALDLAERGKKVTILEMRPSIINEPSLCPANGTALKDFLNLHKVDIKTSVTLREITERGVRFVQNGKGEETPAGTVIISAGYTSDSTLYEKLFAETDADVYLLGDAKEIRNLKNVIWDAYEIASSL